MEENSERGRRQTNQENFVSGKRNFITTRRELLNAMKIKGELTQAVPARI